MFQVTKSGYSSRARVLPEDMADDLELSDVFDEAGVALPFELEPELRVDGKELLLLAADAVLPLKSLEIAAGLLGSSGSVSASVISSSSPAIRSWEAPASVSSWLLLPLPPW